MRSGFPTETAERVFFVPESRSFLRGKIDLAPVDPRFAGILLIEFQNIVAVVQGVFRYLPGISRTG